KKVYKGKVEETLNVVGLDFGRIQAICGLIAKIPDDAILSGDEMEEALETLENELRNRSEEGRTARQGEASEAIATPLPAMAQPASAELATRSNEDQKPGAAATPDESSASAQYDIESQKAERKRLRDAYKAECKRAGVRVTDEMIAHAASKNWTG